MGVCTFHSLELGKMVVTMGSLIKWLFVCNLSDPDDFDGVSGTFSFTSGTTESCVTISVVDDSVRESVPECFTVILGDVTGADLEDPSVATVCIEDNDGKK